jgi:hypothetical protein
LNQAVKEQEDEILRQAQEPLEIPGLKAENGKLQKALLQLQSSISKPGPANGEIEKLRSEVTDILKRHFDATFRKSPNTWRL